LQESEERLVIISKLKVMKSNAGYYIGRGYWSQEFDPQTNPDDVTDDMCGFPYSRESEYFGTLSEANKYLDYINNLDAE